jgi:hypothetical protein
MPGIAPRSTMKSSATKLVAGALTLAILLAASFLIATGVRGGALRPLANAPLHQPR